MRRLLTGGLFASTLLAGCQLLVGIEDRVAVEPVAEASTADGPADGGGDAFDPCSSDNVPPPPSDAADDPSNDRDLVFSMMAIDFGIDAGLPFGVNLDRLCTCPGPSACNRAQHDDALCDEPAGVDNAAKSVLARLGGFAGLDQQSLSDRLRRGGSGALIRVRGYNGRADDPYVTVSIYGSLGVEGTLTGTSSDRFRVDTDTVRAGDVNQPKNSTARAWVSRSVLVAPIGAVLTLGGGADQPPLATELSAGYLVARLDEDTLRGVVSGRWELDTALRSVQNFRAPGSSSPMCADAAAFELLRSVMCGAADVTAKVDEEGRNRECDAMSVQVGFSARLANLGTVASRPDGGVPACATRPSCRD